MKNFTLSFSLKLSGGVLDVHAESSENITTFRFFVFQMLTRWREPLLGLVLDSTFDNLATAVHRFTFISSQSFPMKCFGLDWFGFDWSAELGCVPLLGKNAISSCGNPSHERSSRDLYISNVFREVIQKTVFLRTG